MLLSPLSYSEQILVGPTLFTLGEKLLRYLAAEKYLSLEEIGFNNSR